MTDDEPPTSSEARPTTPSLHPPSMGRVAHAAYCASFAASLATLMPGEDTAALQPLAWDDLSDPERAAWEAAASAVCG